MAVTTAIDRPPPLDNPPQATPAAALQGNQVRGGHIVNLHRLSAACCCLYSNPYSQSM